MNKQLLTAEQPAALEAARQLFASWRKGKIEGTEYRKIYGRPQQIFTIPRKWP